MALLAPRCADRASPVRGLPDSVSHARANIRSSESPSSLFGASARGRMSSNAERSASEGDTEEDRDTGGRQLWRRQMVSATGHAGGAQSVGELVERPGAAGRSPPSWARSGARVGVTGRLNDA